MGYAVIGMSHFCLCSGFRFQKGGGGASCALKKNNYIARELVFRDERKLLSFDRPDMMYGYTGDAI